MLPVVVILIVSAILVFGINIFSLVIIIYWKQKRKPSHLPLISLLLAHTIQGSIVLPAYAAERSGSYAESRILCDTFRFTYLYSNYICCLSVLTICLDRFVGVHYPLHYKAWVTKKRMFYLLVFIWLYLLALCVLPFIPYDRKENCNYNPQKEWVITMLVGHTLIPFAIITVCYLSILKVIATFTRRKEKTFSNIVTLTSLQDRGRDCRTGRTSSKSKVTLLIIGAYILTYGPSLFYYLLMTMCKKRCFSNTYHKAYKSFDGSEAKEITGFVIKMLTLTDGFLSPLFYCCTNATFLIERRNILTRIRCNALIAGEKLSTTILYFEGRGETSTGYTVPEEFVSICEDEEEAVFLEDVILPDDVSEKQILEMKETPL